MDGVDRENVRGEGGAPCVPKQDKTAQGESPVLVRITPVSTHKRRGGGGSPVNCQDPNRNETSKEMCPSTIGGGGSGLQSLERYRWLLPSGRKEEGILDGTVQSN